MQYKNRKFQISCDGGAATGKSTGAAMISKKYKLKFLTSYLLYKYANFIKNKYKPKNKIKILKKKFKRLNYKNLKKINLHSQKISKVSAIIAKESRIRSILKKYQIAFAKKNLNCCIEGRDISTKILPTSNVKFFFVCNLNTASLRRYKELKKRNPNLNLKDVKKTLRIRNILDKNRKNSPLLKHRDSVVIDTGKLGKKAMLNKMSRYVEKSLQN